MDRLLQEAAQAERDQAKVAEDMRFQRQQAVQDGQDQTDLDTPAETAKPTTRKREPRNLATTGKACGRCGGGGQIMGDSGYTGSCPVCMGAGQIKAWVRSR
jgi:DnaJ-class molecular chaperone